MTCISMRTTRILGVAAAVAIGLAGTALAQVPCPPGSTIEAENCGDDTNGGCNMTVPGFQPVSIGETICGTSWSDASTRDTDWFEIVTTQPMVMTWTATAEFPVVAGYVPTSPVPGLGDCSTVTVLDPYVVGDPLVQVSITTECLPPGTHWFFIAPPLGTELTCGVDNDYVVTLTGTPCTLPTGACCLPDLSCMDGLTEVECVLDYEGVFQGGGTDCASVVCLARPCPTDPGSILLEQMTSNEVIAGNGIACGDGFDTTDNGFARSYDLSADPNTAGEVYTVTCVEVGIETSGIVDNPADLNIYVDNNGGPPTGPGIDLTLVGTQAVMIPAETTTEVVGFVLATPIEVPADSVMVVELYVYDSGTNGGVWPGTNDGGESAPSYIRAADCGVPNFATFQSLGFPGVHWVQTVVGISGVPAPRMTLYGEEYDPATPITDPTALPLEELNPNFGTMWDVTEFIDNNANGQLDVADQLRLDDGVNPPELWATESLTACLVIEEVEGGPVGDWIYLEYENVWTGNPIGTYREAYPLFGSLYIVVDWIDNGNGIVDGCDWLLVTPPGGGEFFFHVVNLGTNIGVVQDVGPNPCPEDVNGDNVVNVLDLLLVLAAWDNAGGPEDINGDGVVNVLDLLMVLAAWGPCP